MRALISILTVVDFEISPEHYPGCSTPEDMLEAEFRKAESDPTGWSETMIVTGVGQASRSVMGRLLHPTELNSGE